MHTSVGFLAVASFLLASGLASAQEVAWKTRYREGRESGRQAQKPVAVFVGSGQAGHADLIQEGSFSDGVRKTLADSYVCVYLDADRAENGALIEDLGITSGLGVVLSDRTGRLQAYHYDGKLSASELSSQLQHFADPAVTVNTTVTNTVQQVSYYSPPPATVVPPALPTAVPAAVPTVAIPATVPAAAFQSAPTFYQPATFAPARAPVAPSYSAPAFSGRGC